MMINLSSRIQNAAFPSTDEINSLSAEYKDEWKLLLENTANIFNAFKNSSKDMLLMHLDYTIKNYKWGYSLEKRISEQSAYFAFKVIIKKYFSKKNYKILEIGCGNLIFEHSYLSNSFNLISKKSFNKWTFSDHPNSYSVKFKQAAPFDLSEGKPFNKQFKRIIGCNVLDTLQYRQLENAMKSIKASLKYKGIFIHLADKIFYETTFFNSCLDDSLVILPGRTRNRLYQIQKRHFEEDLAAKKSMLDEKEYKYFRKWGNFSIHFQSMGINDAFLISQQVKFEKLAQKIPQIFPTAREVNKKLTFSTALHNASIKNGLKVIFHGYYLNGNTGRKVAVFIAARYDEIDTQAEKCDCLFNSLKTLFSLLHSDK